MLGIAYKLLTAAFLPSNFIAILGFLGVAALVIRWKRTALWLLSTSSVLLFLAAWSPIGPAMLAALEDRFNVPELPVSVTGIVMLGGAEDAHITESRKSVTLNNNAERIFQTAVLARRFPNARIILSGGGGHLVVGDTLTEAQIAQQVLVELGIASERIETDRQSQTTFENAVDSMAVAHPKPSDTWILVTSAYNMPRAVASFKAVGFATIPYPVDYRTMTSQFRLPFSAVADGLDVTDTAVHEWLGLAAYWLAGKTQTLFPAAN